MVIYPITRRGRVQKRKKKGRNKISFGMFSLAVFLFPVIKRAEKVSGFVFFSGRGEGKCKINNTKKKLFSHFGSFFTIFGR